MSAQVKCLVWDLDETLWSGTLAEGDTVALKPGVEGILEELTRRGIVNSIASHNDREPAIAALERLGVEDYFVAPRIDHLPKPDSLREIAQVLNLSLDALAFIDNDPFERAAVEFSYPHVTVIAAEEYAQLPRMPGFDANSGTAESRERVKSYRDEAQRREAEDAFSGTHLDFLKSCDMELTIRQAEEVDIARVVELAERTNQFNSSGLRYSHEEVESLIRDPNSMVIVAHLVDRFGDSGLIGAMVLQDADTHRLVESLMVSCRVDGRGVPSALLVLAMRLTQREGVPSLFVRFNATERNRRLAFLYQMMGFRPMGTDDSRWSFDVVGEPLPQVPEWLSLAGSFPELKA